MSGQFIYSVLQYKHSLALGEAINIGVLFSFPDKHKLFFVTGNTQRVKCVYPTFDSTIFSKISRSIKSKIDETNKRYNPLFGGDNLSLKDYINSEILPEDSTSLQFTDIFTAVNDSNNIKRAIDEFSKILLPNSEERIEENRHNETYILKKYSEKLIKKVKSNNLDTRLRRDYEIDTKRAKLTFEIAWKNEKHLHLVKPISFDLSDEYFIKDKAVKFWGYLGLLNKYAKEHKLLFDLLVAAPQNKELDGAYQDALDTLQDTKAPKKIFTEDNWEEYSEQTAINLNKDLL